MSLRALSSNAVLRVSASVRPLSRSYLIRCLSTTSCCSSNTQGIAAQELKSSLDDTTYVSIPLQQGEVTTNGWAPAKSRTPRDFLRGRLEWTKPAASRFAGAGAGAGEKNGSGISEEDHAATPTPRHLDDETLMLVKVQTPLDNSHDAAGGIGPMTPTTLLVTSYPSSPATEDNPFLPIEREIDEDEKGHTYLARLAIRHRSTVYL